MWSDTGFTLAEFARLMHLDPYRLAQVDRTGTARPYECDCYYQNTDKYIGRQEIIAAIRFAESTFLRFARFHPVPTAVTGERHEYPKSVRDALKRFRPHYDLVQQFGTLEWDDLGEVALTKDTAGVIRDVFTCTIAVPDDTTAEQLHAYITSADGGGLLPDRAWEIRPLSRVTVDSSGGTGNWTATLEGPAYLFVRPEHYLTADCLAHEVATYVDQITVYRATVNSCEQGRFVFRPNCGDPPCDEQYQDACFERVQNGEYRPHFATCNEDGELEVTSYCSIPSWPPKEIEMNYLAGAPLVRGMMDPEWGEAVFGLALANMDEGIRLCECDNVSTGKYKDYRSVPKTEISEGLSGSDSKQFSLLIEAGDLRRLKGLKPWYGNLLALGIIRRSTPRVGGSTL